MTLALVPDQNDTASELGAWADSFLRTASVAGQLARTAFVPASLRVYRNNGRDYDAEATAAQVTAAVLTGRELGMEPMAALRSINVINSTPALSALALRGVVLSHGHQMVLEEATKTRATVAGRRKGDDNWQRITWTIDDAKDRGLAGKPNWRSQPRNMLIARATAEVARLIDADGLLGIPYSIEEIEDDDFGGQAPSAPPDEAAPPRRTAQRKTGKKTAEAPSEPASAPAEDEPGFDDEPGADARADQGDPVGEQPADTPPLIDDKQMKAMMAGLHDLDITDRGAVLKQIGEWIGRSITSRKQITAAEASTVLDAIKLAKAQQQPDPDAPVTKETLASITKVFDELGIERDMRRAYAANILDSDPSADPRSMTTGQAERLLEVMNKELAAIRAEQQPTTADEPPLDEPPLPPEPPEES